MHAPPSARRRGVIIAIVALAIVVTTAVTAVLLLVQPSGKTTPQTLPSGPPPAASSTPTQPAHQSRPHRHHRPQGGQPAQGGKKTGRQQTPTPGFDGPLVPATGALLGAYVNPGAGNDTPSGYISAVKSFEHQVGQRLAVVHTYHPWTSAFPSLAEQYFADSGRALLLTWGGAPDTKAIVAGQDDAMIRARAEAVKRLGRPIMLEWRAEMDRPDLLAAMHSPADYIAAWDHIRSIFAAAGADNVSWVWCPTAEGFRDGRALAFYPGAKQVDWVCADAYSASPAEPLSTVVAPFLAWAAHQPRPVLISEFGVAGDPSGWASWLTGVGELARTHPQIKALVYFDSDGVNSKGQPYSYSLARNTSATAAFGRLLAQPYFRPTLPSDKRS